MTVYAGIDIGGTSVKIGFFDANRVLLRRETLPSVVGDPKTLADQIAAVVRQMPVDRIGVGTAGAVDPEKGLVTAGNLNWREVPLRQLLEARTGLPVRIDNDAQVALLAEWLSGACQGASNVVYLTLGTGIGGALILDGKPWRGHTHTAAELGHIITHADGLPCSCSRRGCFEMYASASALSRLGNGRSAKEIIDAAARQEAEPSRIFQSYLHELGIGLVTLIVVFNPEVIVLGGGISAAGDILLQGCRAEISRQFAGRPGYFLGDIRLARHGNDAGIIGAASLAAI